MRSIAGLIICASLSCAAGVPKGIVTAGQATSKIYPGAVRKYWVYVPAQYNASKPACVMIFQDGGAMVAATGEWRVPLVMDTLIQQGRIPPVIGVFIDPGVLPGSGGRDNRSYEYDGPGDSYGRFVSEEILPEVAARYNLSKDPNDYAIAGAGSGGTAAIHAAWARPDVFRRVANFTGSDTELSDMLPVLVRKTEPKPLRVFLQDSDKHRALFAALQSMGYESTSFKGARGEAMLAEALRWIWKDYPKPVEKRSQGWELVGQGYQLTADPTVDREGNVFFTDAHRNRIYKIGADGKIALWKEDSGGAHGIAAGPDGRLYVGQHDRRRIVALAADGAESVVTEGVQTHHLVVTTRNEVYFWRGAQPQDLADRYGRKTAHGNRRNVLAALHPHLRRSVDAGRHRFT